MKQKLKWKKEKPVKEGWYFWRRASNIKDPWKWRVVFVTINEGEREAQYDEEGNPVLYSYWEGGTEVFAPTGGWWARIKVKS